MSKSDDSPDVEILRRLAKETEKLVTFQHKGNLKFPIARPNDARVAAMYAADLVGFATSFDVDVDAINPNVVALSVFNVIA